MVLVSKKLLHIAYSFSIIFVSLVVYLDPSQHCPPYSRSRNYKILNLKLIYEILTCILSAQYTSEAKMTIPRTRKNTRSISSLALARNVCMRILSPEEWRVSLNSRRIRMMEKNSSTSAFSRCDAIFCSAMSMQKLKVATQSIILTLQQKMYL